MNSKFFIIAFTFSLFSGIAVMMSRYRKAIRSAHKRLDNLGSQVMETDCGPVEYVMKGEGYPVLVVHGALGGFDQGLFLSRNNEAPNMQVICVSRFGYLRSPVTAGANLDTQADAFARLLDALGIQQVVVFAISSGTTSAIRLAARYPERVSALILLCPDAPGKTDIALPPRFLFDTLMRNDFLYWAMITLGGRQFQTAKGLIPKGYVLTPEQAALVNRVQAGDLPISRRMDGMLFETYTCAEEFKASVTPTSHYPLRQVRTPTLVIHAADDPISIPENVRRLANQMPNARLYTVPDGGHLFFGHAEEVRAEIARFLTRTMADR